MKRPAIDLEQFSDLISTIYDCAIDPHLWPTAIEQIARHIDGASGIILMIDLVENRSRLYVDWNVGPAMGQTFNEQYFADNPLRDAFPKFDVDEPYNISLVMEPARWRETRVYREFGRPNGWLDNVGVNLVKTPSRSASLSITRAEEVGFAGTRERGIMRLLSPHVRRAVSIADLIEMRELTARTFESSFDALAVPIVLVDRDSRIVHANGAARELISAGDPIRSERGVLRARSADSVRRLEAAIAATTPRGGAGESGRVVFIPFADGRLAFAHVLPTGPGGIRGGIEPRAAAMLFITPSREPAMLPLQAWASACGVTAAELRVLELLVQGSTIAAAAAKLAVGVTTARTHLARLMQKTGTRRQADLIRLAMQLESPVRKSGMP